MTGDLVAEPSFPAAGRWAEQLDGWSIPSEILEQAPESPWFHDPRRFEVEDQIDRGSTSTQWAREVLPPVGGTVLDVGCGGGRSVMPLVPPATEVIGVDPSGAMLDRFVSAASAADVARRTVHGLWPDVAGYTPAADVVVCHHVVYNVADILPFVLALTDHARLAVVVELTVVHPMTAWSPAWEHFWGLTRPAGPTADDFLAVAREVGLEPETVVSERAQIVSPTSVPAELVQTTRRRLCLPAERDPDIVAWLAEHPPEFVEHVATVRWPGAAEPIG